MRTISDVVRDLLNPVRELTTADVQELVALPEDYKLASKEPFQAEPDRVRRLVEMESRDSLTEYVRRFRIPSTTAYVSNRDKKAVVVLDHSQAPFCVDDETEGGKGDPDAWMSHSSWETHRATYAFRADESADQVVDALEECGIPVYRASVRW